jgi:hypothetical protein
MATKSFGVYGTGWTEEQLESKTREVALIAANTRSMCVFTSRAEHVDGTHTDNIRSFPRNNLSASNHGGIEESWRQE